MTEYRFQGAVVRIHGEPDHEKLKAASERFLKQVIAAKKKAMKNERKDECNAI